MKLFSFLIAQAYLNCLTTVGFAQCVSCTAAPSIGILNSSGYGCYDGSVSVSISGICNPYDVSLIGQSSFNGVLAGEVVVFDQQTSGEYILQCNFCDGSDYTQQVVVRPTCSVSISNLISFDASHTDCQDGFIQVTGLTNACDPFSVQAFSTDYFVIYTFQNSFIAFGLNGDEMSADVIPGHFSLTIFNSRCHISFKGQSILETWAFSPLTIARNAFYDFTSTNNVAFGNNLKALGLNVFGIYRGDIVKDAVIDLLLEQNSLSTCTHTYDPSDLNGDSISESADFSLLENNLNSLVRRP